MPETDDDMLRTIASCANEAVEATMQPAARVQPAMQKVVARYGRALEISLADLQDALLAARTVAPPDDEHRPGGPAGRAATASAASPAP